MSHKSSLWVRFRTGQWEDIPTWQFNLLTPFVAVLLAVREFFRDGALVLSSSLAYTTAISIVPLLSVVMSALALFGVFDKTNASLIYYLEPVFPAAASSAATYLHSFAQTSATSVGGISAVVFLVVAIFLFMDIERAFNAIWHARNDRPILRKILTFYFVVTFGPVLVVLSVGLTARAQLVVDRFGLETGIFTSFAPFLIAFALFTFMHQLLPNTRVHWSAAIVGGLFTAIAFEAAKFGFNVYIAQVILESYNTIYGALGLFPLFLIWVYICWIIVLLGAELAYSVQNLRTIVEVDAAKLRTPAKQKHNIYNPLVGLEVMAPIARNFKAGDGAIREADLIRQTGYDEMFLREVISELEQIGAAKAVEVNKDERAVMPSKMLDDISLVPIAEHFFDFSEPNSGPMRLLQAEFRRVTLEQLSGKTAMSLIPGAYTSPQPAHDWSASNYPDNSLVSGAEARRVYSDPDAPPVKEAAPKAVAGVSGQSSTNHENTDLSRRSPTDSLSIEVSDDLVMEESLLLESAVPSSPTALRSERQLPPSVSRAGEAPVPAPFEEILITASMASASLEIDLGEDWDEFDMDQGDLLNEVSLEELRKTAEMPEGALDASRQPSDD